MSLVVHPWLPNSPKKIKEDMLKTIGVKEVSELFSDIPEKVRFKGEWDKLEIGFGRPLSELEIQRIIDDILSKNKVFKKPPVFLGAGVWPHYVPEVVKYIMSRAEFCTTYTPYQAEISQGLLQALFEYQSMIADLLEMEVVNASMYDWASAVAEAFLMALRVNKGKNRILIPSTMNPMHLEVVKTYTMPRGVVIEKVKYDSVTGLIDLEDLKEKVAKGNVAAVYIENPSFLGFIEENARDVGEIAHDGKALFIMGVDPISLGILKPPGALGADIAVGEGQPLGLGLNYGGPYLGIFAVKWDMKLIRQMPGRLIGLTTTVDGKDRAFTMILQTREQHIRREKATSNICTNEALCALGAAVYLALMGKHGLKKLGELILYRTNYAIKKMNTITGVKAPIFKSLHFKEFTVNFDKTNMPYTKIHKELLKKGIHGGLYLREFFPEFGETALYCVTELHTKDDIDLLIKSLKEIVEGWSR